MIPMTRDMVFRVAQFSKIPLLFSLLSVCSREAKSTYAGKHYSSKDRPASTCCPLGPKVPPAVHCHLRVHPRNGAQPPCPLLRSFLDPLQSEEMFSFCSLTPAVPRHSVPAVFHPLALGYYFSLYFGLWFVCLCLSVCVCVSFLHLLILGMCGKANGRCGLSFSQCHTVQWMACAISSLEQSNLLAYLWWFAGHMFYLGF